MNYTEAIHDLCTASKTSFNHPQSRLQCGPNEDAHRFVVNNPGAAIVTAQ
jgi:hypothetical protein